MNGELEKGQLPAKRGTWRWMLAAVLLLIPGTGAVILLSDEKLKPYDDLKLSAVPDARTNGYLYLKERWQNLPLMKEEESSRLRARPDGRDPSDASFLLQLLKGRETIREEWRTALDMPSWIQPGPDKTLKRETEIWLIDLIRLFQLEAGLAFVSGNVDPSVTLQKELAAWCGRQLEGAGGVSSAIFVDSIQNESASLSCDMLDEGRLNDAQLEETSRIWDSDPPAAAGWDQAMRNESEFFRNLLELVHQGEEIPLGRDTYRLTWRERLLFKLNRTLNTYHGDVRRIAAAAFNPFPDLDSARGAGVGEGLVNSAPIKVGGWGLNATGNELLTTRRILDNALPGLYRLLFVPRAMRVRIAVHRWRKSHPGQWPASLTELVPDYLPEIPKDPWNGNALMWDQAMRTVYAVGTDWRPDPPVFDRENQDWFSRQVESPGLRMERPAWTPPPGNPTKPGRRVVLSKP